MTLDFRSIPYDLQILVAAKMDFWSLLQLKMTSIEGFVAARSVNHAGVLEVEKISFADSIIRFAIYNPSTGKRMNKRWDHIRQFDNLPVFTTTVVELWPDVSIDYLNFFATEIRILRTKAKVIWSPQAYNAPQIFVKLHEIFNIVEFDIHNIADYILSNVVEIPEFIQLETINFPMNNIPDNLFLELRAQTIQNVHLVSRPTVTSTLNSFLRQWLLYQRDIISLSVRTDPSNTADDLFRDLPVKLVCSNVHVVTDYYDIREVFFLDRGDSILLITLRSYVMNACELTDPLSFEAELDELVYNGITQRANEDGYLIIPGPREEETKSRRFRRKPGCTIS